MIYQNTTKNQHYISQAELRFNSISSSKVENKNKKIFQYELISREKYKITLKNKKGSKINSILSDYDLFTFSTIDKRFRENLECLFSKYEKQANFLTKTLINNEEEGMSSEEASIKLLHLKLLNSIRNPYVINKTVDLLSFLYDIENKIISTKKIKDYVESSTKSHGEYISSKYGVSLEQYNKWLSILISTLECNIDGENILDIVVNKLISDKKRLNLLYLYKYKASSPLLSDTSYVTPNLGRLNNNSVKYDFNVSSNSFIRFVSLPLPEQVVTKFSNELEYSSLKRMNIKFEEKINDMNVLESYNKSVISQCNSMVFCATNSIYGVNIST